MKYKYKLLKDNYTLLEWDEITKQLDWHYEAIDNYELYLKAKAKIRCYYDYAKQHSNQRYLEIYYMNKLQSQNIRL